jgi:hypothetical protein
VATSNILPPETNPNLLAILPALDDANPFGKSSVFIFPLPPLKGKFKRLDKTLPLNPKKRGGT